MIGPTPSAVSDDFVVLRFDNDESSDETESLEGAEEVGKLRGGVDASLSASSVEDSSKLLVEERTTEEAVLERVELVSRPSVSSVELRRDELVMLLATVEDSSEELTGGRAGGLPTETDSSAGGLVSSSSSHPTLIKSHKRPDIARN